MARLEITTYPRLKSHPTASDPAAAYTPTWDEVMTAYTSTTGLRTRDCFLILLKTDQRLGYPMLLEDVPAAHPQLEASGLVSAQPPEPLPAHRRAFQRRRGLAAD
jgi:hypothetical protein